MPEAAIESLARRTGVLAVRAPAAVSASPQMATTTLALLALAAAVSVSAEAQPAHEITKVTVTSAMKARKNGGGPDDAPSSFWTPNIVVTTNGTIVIMAMAKPTFTNYMVSSRDAGATWTKHAEPMGPPGTSQLVYSPTSDTLFLLGKSPNMVDNGTRPDPANGGWLWQSKSMDAGMTWSEPAAINQTNVTYGPHYGGSGRTQGIELTRGLHKGRLVVAKIGASLAEQPIKPPHGKAGRAPTHAFAMYSDNNGETWALGEELGPKGSQSAPKGVLVWDEDTLTELKNGSVLLSARIDDPEDRDEHHPDTNTTRVHTTRGFARSDDGAWVSPRLRTQTYRTAAWLLAPHLLMNFRFIHTP